MKQKLATAAAFAVLIALGRLSAEPSVQESSRIPTLTALVASPSPSAANQQITLTATVKMRDGSTTDVPGGMVEFFDAARSLGLAPLVSGESGTVTASLTLALGAGSHPLAANYKGDARFEISISPPLVHLVNQP